MKEEVSIVWFRQDLRISDNLAINAASEQGKILPIYILDDPAPGESFKIGSASKIWLHQSISKLDESLSGSLNLYIGKASEVIKSLTERYFVKNIFWNICFEPWHLEQESEVIDICHETSTKWKAFNSNYLWHPNQVLKDDGSYYKIFTAYKNKAYLFPPRDKNNQPKNPIFLRDSGNKTNLSDFTFLPQISWYKNIEKTWDVGENAAQQKLDFFIENHLSGYKENRNYPAKDATSKLSPHLHFGEISPVQIWHSINHWGPLNAPSEDINHFLSELIWRDFSCYLLYHFAHLYKDNFNRKFDNFSWEKNSEFLKAWQTGNTGYPIIDAGMRELWQTGYMHNRVRMVVASFLVKNLNIHWHYGRDWFWDCLIDADLANNSASWQWVAGSGVDAAPYFRIFNPITQGEKFDSDGLYIRKFVPELKKLPDRYLFKPWTAPKDLLELAGITLGETYPNPIVDFSTSRKKALDIYKNL